MGVVPAGGGSGGGSSAFDGVILEYNTTVQDVLTTTTELDLGALEYGDSAYLNVVTPKRITATKTGVYYVSAGLHANANFSGLWLFVLVDGVEIGFTVLTTNGGDLIYTTSVYLTVGQYVEIGTKANGIATVNLGRVVMYYIGS